MTRYKHLADLVKKKKVQNSTDEEVSSTAVLLEHQTGEAAIISPSS